MEVSDCYRKVLPLSAVTVIGFTLDKIKTICQTIFTGYRRDVFSLQVDSKGSSM